MKANQVNVEYMYAFVYKSAVNATIIFRFNDLEKGIACLQAGRNQDSAGRGRRIRSEQQLTSREPSA